LVSEKLHECRQRIIFKNIAVGRDFTRKRLSGNSFQSSNMSEEYLKKWRRYDVVLVGAISNTAMEQSVIIFALCRLLKPVSSDIRIFSLLNVVFFIYFDLTADAKRKNYHLS